MDNTFNVIDDLDNKRNNRGYETRWSIFGNHVVNMTDEVVAEDFDAYRVTYHAYDDERNQMCEFSAFAATNTVESFWAAAECCFQQAKQSVNDWHVFIEGFNRVEDGSFRLTTGS